MAMSAEHMLKFAAPHRQSWHLRMSKKFSSGTKTPNKQTNKQTKNKQTNKKQAFKWKDCALFSFTVTFLPGMKRDTDSPCHGISMDWSRVFYLKYCHYGVKPPTILQSPGIEVCLLLLNIHYGRYKIRKVRQHTNTTINYLSLSFCFKRILGKKS